MKFTKQAIIYIKDVIDFQLVAERLSCLFPKSSEQQIESAFKKYFQGREDSEYWIYEEMIEETINDLIIDFVAENQNETRESAEIALNLNMPILDGKISKIYKAGAWL